MRFIPLAFISLVMFCCLNITATGAGNYFIWTESSAGLPSDECKGGCWTGDIDGDGTTDIAAADISSGYVQFFRGDGSGNWAAQGRIDITYPGGICLGDVNKDKKIDVGISCYEETGDGIRVYLGDGDFKWTNCSEGLPTSGHHNGICFGDIDNDGCLDLAAGTGSDYGKYGKGIEAFRYDNGTWKNASGNLPCAGNYFGVNFGDFNSDGNADIAAGGGGSGTSLTFITMGSGRDSDIALGNSQAYARQTQSFIANGKSIVKICTYLSKTGIPPGDITFGIRKTLNGTNLVNFTITSEQVRSTDIATPTTIELNANPPLAVNDSEMYYMTMSVPFHDAGNFYRIPIDYKSAYTDGMLYSGTQCLPDPDNDTVSSMALIESSVPSVDEGVHVWAGDGKSNWTYSSNGLPSIGKYYGVFMGDVNKDGKPDIGATANQRFAGAIGGVRVFRGDGAGNWTNTSNGLATDRSYYGVWLGDIDGDCCRDIVAASAEFGGGLQVWRYLPGTQSWVEESSGLPKDAYFYGACLADVNSDNKLDIVATSDSGVRVLLCSINVSEFSLTLVPALVFACVVIIIRRARKEKPRVWAMGK